MSKGSGRHKPTERTHIISRDRGWAVKEGNSKASRVLHTKGAAIRNAQKLKRQGYDIVIHRRDGSIQRWEKARD